jgi:hypothetical protein
VLGTGAIAQQQVADSQRADLRRVVVAEEDVELDIRLVDDERDDEEAVREPRRTKVRVRDGDERRAERVKVRLASPEERGYWLGLQFEPVSEALRSQLKLEANQGLVVTELYPDTPAVKAGLAKHDVVVKVDDTAASDINTINQAVQATKGEKEITLSVYRGGKLETIKVTPAKRPGEDAFALRLAHDPADGDVLMRWLPRGVDPEHSARIEFLNPGVMVDKGGSFKVQSLPKGLSISISKSGDEPAKISVAKGEEKWDVTEKELDKLPAEVREHVERMLRPGPWETRLAHVRPHVEFVPRGIVTVTPPQGEPGKAVPPPVVAPLPPIPAPGADVHRRLDEVNERLEQLQKALEALTKQQAEQAKQ